MTNSRHHTLIKRNAAALSKTRSHNPIVPCLSIIIISRNEEKYLPRLLDSINRQRYDSPFEVILSDVSTDSTPKIAKSSGCRVIKGGLPAIGRNRGAAAARGRILLFLDADVLLPSHFLSKNLAEFERQKLGIAAPFSIPMSNNMLDRMIWAGYNDWARVVERFNPHGVGHCIACTKALYDTVHGFDETVVIGEDHDFVRRCSKQGKYRILGPVPIYVSVRRWEREGRIKLLSKYLLNEFHRLFIGEMKKCPFDYEMNGVNLKDVGRKDKNGPKNKA